MRIEKDGLYADVTEDAAALLIKDRGWQASSVKSSGPARFVSPEEIDKLATHAAMMVATGGKEVPPNVDWTGTVITGGGFVGLVEFRCINGQVQFRGSLKGSISAAGSYVTVRAFAEKWKSYVPTLETNLTAFAIDTGVQYRVAAVRITPSGMISLSAPTGKFDTVNFDGIGYPVF